MNLKYTIIEGSFNGEKKSCKLPFALVFEENGVFYLETYLKEGFFEEADLSKRFNLIGTTEKGFEIEINDLTFRSYKSGNGKANLVCRNYLKITEKVTDSNKEKTKETEDAIHFIEIEGFKTRFAHRTDIKKIRKYGEIDKFNVNFDHTSCRLYIQIEGHTENYFHLIFSANKANNNIQVDFTKKEGCGRLTFEHYKVFKQQLIGFLCLLNGGKVRIRKELTGEFYRTDGTHAQLEYIFSFSNRSSTTTSNYIPINDHHTYSTSIFQEAFSNCFNSYYHNDKSLGLTSIVTSINVAHSTSGIHESYSILINALEKLCSNYQKSINEFDPNLIASEIWEDSIKESLIKVIESNKSLINSSNKNAFGIFKSKLGDLNRRKNSTVQKMYDLFEFGCIPINTNVENLVTKERHSAVHNGEFGGDSTELFVNYQKLDHILRDLILNIIDFRSHRKSIYDYATEKEKKDVNPERKREIVTHMCSQPYRN